MNTQFIYTRKEAIAPKEEGGEITFKTYQDSFNTAFVIRSVELQDGQRLVLLNDFHERVEEVPQRNKQGLVKSYINKRNTFQSEIYLNKEDSERFLSLYK